MFKNYLLIAYRNLLKQKIYGVINIFGLTIGITCFVLAILYVSYQLSYDTFHKNSDRIYRVIVNDTHAGADFKIALTVPPLGKSLEENYPFVEKGVCTHVGWGTSVRYGDKVFRESDFLFVQDGFFDIFSFPAVQGSTNDLFKDLNTVIITKEMSQKYFGDKNPIGEILECDYDISLKVVSVIENVPTNSQLQFNFLIPIDIYEKFGRDLSSWDTRDYYTYILTSTNADKATMRGEIHSHLEMINPDDTITSFYEIQPLTDVYLRSDYSYDFLASNNGLQMLFGISLISTLILILACINYINMTTARSEFRSKEIGIRKVVGAYRRQLSFQFIFETFFQTFIGFFLAMVLIELLHPLFNQTFQTNISIDYKDFTMLLILVGILMMTTLLAGVYTTFYLSSLIPVKVLHVRQRSKAKGGLFRKVLVVLQLSISTGLIIIVLIFSKQLNLLNNKDLGYDKENLLCTPLSPQIEASYDAFKAELLKNPKIASVTAVMNLPIWSGPSASFSDWEGNTDQRIIKMFHGSVDYDYFKTLGIDFDEGRPFSKDYATDKTDAIIVNQTAVDIMGMDSPIGKNVNFGGEFDWGLKGKIIGVVKDYHYSNLREKIEPLMLKLAPEETNYIFLRYVPGSEEEVKSYYGEVWSHYDSTPPERYYSISWLIEWLYSSEKNMGQIITTLTILAMVISFLGVLGLSAYIAENKSKEIGIRKVFGASVPAILKMISIGFSWLCLIAAVISWPLSWYYVTRLLDSYVYRIEINIWTFIIATLIIYVLTILIVSFQSYRTANRNPVDSLRYE